MGVNVLRHQFHRFFKRDFSLFQIVFNQIDLPHFAVKRRVGSFQLDRFFVHIQRPIIKPFVNTDQFAINLRPERPIERIVGIGDLRALDGVFHRLLQIGRGGLQSDLRLLIFFLLNLPLGLRPIGLRQSRQIVILQTICGIGGNIEFLNRRGNILFRERFHRLPIGDLRVIILALCTISAIAPISKTTKIIDAA